MKLRNRTITSTLWHAAAVFALALLAASAAHAQRIPKDTDSHRFVPPGQEEALTVGLPPVLEAKMLGIEILHEGTVEAAAKKYPSYLWQSIQFPLRGDRLRDPDDATGWRVLYFFGIDTAKRMAYRNVFSGSKSFRAWAKTDRIFVQEIPSIDEAEFGCMHYGHMTFFGSFKKSEAEKRRGEGWFSCTATVVLPLINGAPRHSK